MTIKLTLTLTLTSVQLSVSPSDLEPMPAERHPSQLTDGEAPPREPGANGSGSTAPRSTEGSVSEDVFTESELSPIREEEHQASSDDLCLMDKSSGASTESVRTVTRVDAGPSASQGRDGSVSEPAEASAPVEDKPPNTAAETQARSPAASKQHSLEGTADTSAAACTASGAGSASQVRGCGDGSSRPGSESSAEPGASEPPSSQEGACGEGTSDSGHRAGEHKDTVEPTEKEGPRNAAEGNCTLGSAHFSVAAHCTECTAPSHRSPLLNTLTLFCVRPLLAVTR